MTSSPDMPVADLTARLAVLNTDKKLKGKRLEEFCAVFFGALPGVTVAYSNVENDKGSQELDLILSNAQLPEGLDMLKDIIFVESKNWKDPVGSAEVAWFDWKIRLGGDSFVDGVFVVANGITGREGDSSAALDILQWANREGRRHIVISPEEMVTCKTAADVRALFIDKRLRLSTGRSPFRA